MKNRNITIVALSGVPALMYSSSLESALVLSLSVLVTALLSRLISYPLIKKSSRGAAVILLLIINSTLVSAVGMVLSALFYAVYYPVRIYFSLSALSMLLFLPLFDDGEMTFKEAVSETLTEALLYLLLVILTALLREVFGSGTIWGKKIFDALVPSLSGASGAFFTYGIVLALLGLFYKGKEEVK